MEQMKKFAFWIYPAVILSVLIFFGTRPAHAGRVRKMILTEERPGIVHLALGRTTAISFLSKPEKLVLGSPEKVHVDFLNRDITVSPLAKNPGNLLVYTKSARYVILFDLGSSSNYDDVVEIRPGGRPRFTIQLLDDTVREETLQITLIPSSKRSSTRQLNVPVLVTMSELRIGSTELYDALESINGLHCVGCSSRRSDNNLQLYCGKPIQEVQCSGAGYSKITLKRSSL